jgi:hypothetical protein
MKKLLVLIALLCVVIAGDGQTCTLSSPITIATTPSMTSVLKIGVNLGFMSEDSSGRHLNNIIHDPGVEPVQHGHLIFVGNTPTTTITDLNDQSYPSFTGPITGTIEVGTCSDASNPYCTQSTGGVGAGGCTAGTCNAGTQFTMTSFTTGGTYTCSGSCPTLHVNTAGSGLSDIVAYTFTDSTRQIISQIGQWNFLTNVAYSTAFAHQGVASAAFDVSASNASTSLQNVFDSNTPGGGTCANNTAQVCGINADCTASTCVYKPQAFTPITGSWTHSFWYMIPNAQLGAPACTATLSRAGGNTSLNHTFSGLTVDGAWHQVTPFVFTGADTSGQTGNLTYALACTNGVTAHAGAKIYVDDFSLGTTSVDPSGMNNDLITALTNLGVGVIRNMQGGGGNLAVDYLHYSGNDFVRSDADDIPVAFSALYSYSMPEVIAAAKEVGAVPWLTIPAGLWTDTELTSFGNDLCTAISANGFPIMPVEWGNEVWSGADQGVNYSNHSSIYMPTYSLVVKRQSAIIMAACPNANIHFVASAQRGNTTSQAQATGSLPNTAQFASDAFGYCLLTQGISDTIPTVVANGYTACTTQNNLWASTTLAGLCGGTPAGCLQSMYIYEENNDNTSSTASVVHNWQYAAGIGDASVAMVNMTQAIQNLVPIQIHYDMKQTDVNSTGGASTAAFSVITAGAGLNTVFNPVSPNVSLRPIGLAIKLMNQAIGGDYYACSGVPTGVGCVAFKVPGNKWQAFLYNTNAAPILVAIAFPAGTSVPSTAMTLLDSAGSPALSDNNENSSTITVGAGVAPMVSGQNVAVTIPAQNGVTLK